MLVPTIVIIQLAKKQKLLAVFSAVIGVAAFAVTKLLENSEFYADQFSSYYLSLHIFHLSTTHKEVLIQFLLCSIPLLLIGAFYLIRLFLNGEKAVGIALILAVALALFGFMLSKNVQTVIMIIVPLFAAVVALNDKACEQISQFFANHVFLFLLTVAFVAGAPMVLGTLPYDSELFSRSTFIIFREQ